MEGSNNAPVDSAAPAEQATNSTENENNVDKVAETKDAQAPVPNKKKYKIKVDGQEFEEELDLNDDEGIKRHIQMSKAAQKRMSESAKIKQQAEQFLQALQTDPVKLLSNPKLGLDFRKIAEEYLTKQLEVEMLSPEQRKSREMEERLKAYEEEKRQATEKQRADQQSMLEQHYAQSYDKTITEALANSGLPKTPKTVKRMAELLYSNLKNGFELEPKSLVEMVRQDYINEIKELFGAANGDLLLQLLGDDVANKIRKTDLAKLRTVQPEFKKPEALGNEQQSQKRVTTEEWLAERRKRIMGT